MTQRSRSWPLCSKRTLRSWASISARTDPCSRERENRGTSGHATLKSVIIIDSSHLHWRIQRTLTDWRTSSRRNAMQISSLRSSLAAQRSHSQGRRTVHCRVASATDSSSSQPLKVSMVGGLTASKKKSPPFPYPLTRSPLARRPGVPRVSEKHRGRRGHPWRPVPKRL
jgi:hypothetical protein